MVTLRLHPTEGGAVVPVDGRSCGSLADLRRLVAHHTGVPAARIAFFHAGVRLPPSMPFADLPQGDATRLNLVLLSAGSPIGLLPPEMLRAVLEYVESARAMAVCRLWRQVGRLCLTRLSPSRRPSLTPAAAATLLYPSLTDLDFSGARRLDDSVLSAISAAVIPLRRLNLRECPLPRDFQLLRSPTLEWLNISGCAHLTRPPAAALLPRLRHLLHSDRSIGCPNIADALQRSGFPATVPLPVLRLRLTTVTGASLPLVDLPKTLTVGQLRILVGRRLGSAQRPFSLVHKNAELTCDSVTLGDCPLGDGDVITALIRLCTDDTAFGS
jgi:hypothetical protein